MESLLELGADPNALHPERGICALSAAVVQGEAGVTRALVDHGAALLGAGSQDKPIVVRASCCFTRLRALPVSIPPCFGGLQVAVEGGALDIVSYLLQVAAYQSIQMSYKMANTALLVTGHGRETDSKAATRTVLHIAAIHGFAEVSGYTQKSHIQPSIHHSFPYPLWPIRFYLSFWIMVQTSQP